MAIITFGYTPILLLLLLTTLSFFILIVLATPIGFFFIGIDRGSVSTISNLGFFTDFSLFFVEKISFFVEKISFGSSFLVKTLRFSLTFFTSEILTLFVSLLGVFLLVDLLVCGDFENLLVFSVGFSGDPAGMRPAGCLFVPAGPG